MNEAICQVCPHHCRLPEGAYGRCRARKNDGGTVVCSSYGKLTSIALDPIEKKPLAYFRPGSRILSVGSFGCNMACPFCQNFEIADAGEADMRRLYDVSPAELCELAKEACDQGNIGVAFTYNEPLVGYEFVRDTARLVHEAGMKNVLVSNGTASQAVLRELLPWIDAMNIDIKSFREETYAGVLGGSLSMVKAFIETAAVAGTHLELTALIVPGMNDSEEEMRALAGWVADLDGGRGRDIPLHVTRFFPRFRMTDRGATPVPAVYRLAEEAGRFLRYVYVGNC